MKVNLAYLISVLIAVLVVAAGFTFFQVSEERTRLNDELFDRLTLISDQIVRSGFERDPPADRQRMIQISDSICKRSGLLGMTLFDNNNELISTNSDISRLGWHSINYVRKNISSGKSTGSFFKDENKFTYQFIKPLKNGSLSIQAIALYSDATYIQSIIKNIWVGDFIRWSIQILVMVVATSLLIRWGIFKPINSIVNWIKAIKNGNVDILNQKSGVGFLAPLQKEIINIASAMQEARATAEEEARLRTTNEAIWTPDRLREEVKKILPGKTLVVVSNREPYMHVHTGKDIKCIVPASGMVTAMEPILKACGGLWIAAGSGDADKETVDKYDKIAVPPGEEKYIMRRVWISEQEEQHFYYGFSNEGIWPLCHLAYTRPIFRGQDWEYYQKVNQKFARAVLEEIREVDQPYILVQDYHFALLPEMIKRERPDATVAIFWHIPWPNQEAFGICPWQFEILNGMLGADLIGFHTQYQCNNFLETVNKNIDSRVRWDNYSVKIGNSTTFVKSFPISIAFTQKDYEAPVEQSPNVEDILGGYSLKAQYMGIGVERIDYTKGIVERFRALEHFFELNPKYIGKFTFVQIGAPSRTLLKSYSDTIAQVESESARINQKFKQKDWKAILLLISHHSHEEILPFYRAADLCMVTSLHDGMNLVAKEFVASRSKNDGVLILSRFAGASHELNGALLINPYDIIEMSEAIKVALEMPVKMQVQKMQRMRQHIVEHNIYHWAAALVQSMVSIQS